MNIFAWIVVSFIAFGAIASIALVGKQREPSTPGVVAISTVLSAGLIALVVLAATV